jgi:hypothetical protein
VRPDDLTVSAERIPFGSPLGSCSALRGATLPLGDRVIVRLWMKKGEIVTRQVDTIRVIR